MRRRSPVILILPIYHFSETTRVISTGIRIITMPAEQEIRQLMVARRFYDMAAENFRLAGDASAIAAISLIQDAIEVGLLAAANNLNVPKGERFDAFVEAIDAALKKAGKSALALRNPIKDINKLRVNGKHHGLRPDQTHLDRAMQDGRTFLTEITQNVFDADFWSINLTSLLPEGRIRDHLIAAEVAYKNKRFREVLIECRKAFYYEFDVRYVPGAYAYWLYDSGASRRNDDYTRPPTDQTHANLFTCDPFDHVELNFPNIDHTLLTDAIDPHTFAKVRSMMPKAYLWRTEEWSISKHVFVFDSHEIDVRAAYVLENVIEIILKRTRKDREPPEDLFHATAVARARHKVLKVY